MRLENQRMKEFLNSNGLDAQPKYIWDGSLKRTWRLYNHSIPWTEELGAQLTGLGFTGLHGPFGKYDGNGGVLSIFVCGHYEMLEGTVRP